MKREGAGDAKDLPVKLAPYLIHHDLLGDSLAFEGVEDFQGGQREDASPGITEGDLLGNHPGMDDDLGAVGHLLQGGTQHLGGEGW